MRGKRGSDQYFLSSKLVFEAIRPYWEVTVLAKGGRIVNGQ